MLLSKFTIKFLGISKNTFLSASLNFRFWEESGNEDSYYLKIKEIWGPNFDSDKEKLTKSEFYNKFLDNVTQGMFKGKNLKDRFTIANFIASNAYRHSSLRSQRVFLKMLATMKKQKDYEEMTNGDSRKELQEKYLFDLKDLFISLAKINCYDLSIIKIFVQIIKNEKNLAKLEFPHKLGILWGFKKFQLNKDFPEVYEEILGNMKLDRSKLTYTTLLRYLWFLSFEDRTKIIEEELLALLVIFQNIMSQKDFISYNFKNSNHICQVFMNIFPEITKNFFEGERDLKILSKMIVNPNSIKYLHFLDFMVELADKAFKIHVYNNDRKSENSMLLTLYEQKNAPNFLIYKTQKIYPARSFEDSVYEIFSRMKGLKLQRNIKFGIYEIDILLNSDTFVEINGNSHFITCENGKKMFDLKFKMKLAHLKLFGISKLVLVNYFEWEKLNDDKNKKNSYLEKLLKNPLIFH